MFGTDSVIRDYTVARNDYRNVMPETFNFAFDVIDVRGVRLCTMKTTRETKVNKTRSR